MFGHLLCKSPMISVASYLIISSIDGSIMANQQTKKVNIYIYIYMHMMVNDKNTNEPY